MKIAFLDDHPQLAETFAKMIRKSFPDAAIDCHGGWEDLEPVLVGMQYDILFLDMRLDDCLGAELIPAIREASPNTRIIVLSAFAQQDLLLKCRQKAVEEQCILAHVRMDAERDIGTGLSDLVEG